MRSRSAHDLSDRCPACRLRHGFCICDDVVLVRPPLEIVVIRHALESLKSSNTARIASLALPSLRIVEYGVKDAPFDVSALALDGAGLLYPSTEPQTPSPPPRRLIVLDGNWTQARRMLLRVTALHTLPRVSVAPPASTPLRARDGVLAGRLTTIEAIAGALDALGMTGGADLRALGGLFARRILEMRGR